MKGLKVGDKGTTIHREPNGAAYLYAVKKSSPDIYEEILSLSFFIVQKGLALSRCDIWSVSPMHSFEKPI